MTDQQAKAAARLNGPALKPPAGVSPDPTLSGRSNEQVWFFVTVGLCLGISGIFMALRYYAKLSGKKKITLVDGKSLLDDEFLWYLADSIRGFLVIGFVGSIHRNPQAVTKRFTRLVTQH